MPVDVICHIEYVAKLTGPTAYFYIEKNFQLDLQLSGGKNDKFRRYMGYIYAHPQLPIKKARIMA
jgi:hypothetical protein